MTQSASSRQAMPPRAVLFIICGIIAISSASILVRYAQNSGAPSLFIAAGRLTIAALLLTPVILMRHRPEIATLRRNDIMLAIGAGALLAVHFATWIASLEHTSVLISSVLVATSPLWVALLEIVFLRARLSKWVIVGLAFAIIGGMIIGLGGDTDDIGTNPLFGGVLALSGGLALSVYLLIGRNLRSRLSLVPYIWLVYGCAAIILLCAVFVTQTPISGFDSQGYLWIFALAIAPQLIGHSSLNYALRYLSATLVSILTQLEPLGSAIAAFILLKEYPQPLQWFGSFAVLIGVVLAIYGQQPPAPDAENNA